MGRSPSKYAFHVAPAAARASIELHGIDCARQSESVWLHRPVAPRGSDSYPEANYLWTTQADAEAYVEYSVGKPGTAWDVWKVDVSGLEYEVDPMSGSMTRWQEGKDYEPSILFREPIPCDRVRHCVRIAAAPTMREPETALRLGAANEATSDAEGTLNHVRAIFADVLGASLVQATDDFFALGGHSMLAAVVIARIRRELGLTILFQEFFADPTPAAVTNALEPLNS